MHSIMKNVGKHVAALILFLGLVMAYFSPAVFDGKVIRQGDNVKAAGMGGSQVDKYAKTAEPGEFSVWSDAMFSGMPYGPGYGNPAPELPSYSIIDGWLKAPGYTHAAMVFVGLVCFYLLMCVMGVNWWLAIAGAIAFAFASYNIIIIEAGHIVKAYVIGYMPVTLAGMFLLFKRKWLWGAVLFLLGVAFSLMNGHIQITYYLVLLCLFIYIGYTIKKLKEKETREWLKTSLIMLACVALAVLPNAKDMYANWDLGQHSIRGASELTPKPDETGKVEKASSGLDKDYAFQWSYGWKELLTVMIPDVYGGSSGGTLDSSSELHKELKKNGAQVGKEVQTYTYWGDKPFTSGPVYFGALVCFLFVLGMFVVRNPMKWWLFAGSIFLTFLALGRNFDAFNDIMFHYLPLYNKFRTVEMALVIPGFVFPIVGIWGLREIFRGNVDDKTMKNGFLWSVGITGGICLIIFLVPSLLLNFHSVYDAQFQNQVPEWYYTALLMDRASLASADALRSLIFILLGAALLLWYWKAKNKKTASLIVSAGMAVLILVDLWSVDRRYLNDGNYVKEKAEESYKESVADKEIFKDTDESYRVFGLTNPWQDTNVSYFHHSIGGYHAVKLRRYQELIDHRLDGEYRNIIGALQKAQTIQDIMPVLAASPSLNMLNTRYIIYNPDQAPIRNPFAYGNAWFVDKIDIVENADAEIEALNTINPLETAVVDKSFAKDLEGFTPHKDSTATIVLEKYRPNRLTYKTKTSSEQLAVFSEIYYPGWKVTIDGKDATHFRADWILRGMLVPAGEHTIVFDFHPDTYVLAANVSAYSSFLILLLLIVAVGWSGWQIWQKKRD
ncbi:YfhO family protein [Parabacteroides faecis]|uniref:YfhO family protein n=1 Tax=Parabacteroides faecis TaxID=1217282 RepID=UPI00216499D0|nr:YfhO family protein [Parabacteroides faecis]MCS2890914.1 YfhO family protein [Parabacteroides faecis]UVQ45428.1 YfhO family protein [Parabacteroides faecis]